MKKHIDHSEPFNILWEQNTKIIQIIPGTDWFVVGKDADGDLIADPITAFGLTEHGDIHPIHMDRECMCHIAPDGFKGELIHKSQMTDKQLHAIDACKYETD